MSNSSERSTNFNQALAHEARLNRIHRLFKTHYNVTEPSLVLEPYLFLGNCISAHDIHRLTKLGIRYVLNVAKRDVEVCPYYPKEMRTLTLDLRDDDRENIARAFDQAFAFIDEARRVQSRVLVHCSHGQSRSPAIVVAYLMRSYGVPLEQCMSHVVKARPCVIPNDGFLKQLILFDRFLNERRMRQQQQQQQQQQKQQQQVVVQQPLQEIKPAEIPIQHHASSTTESVHTSSSSSSNSVSDPVTISSIDSSSIPSSVSNSSIQVIPIQIQSKESTPEKIEPIPIQKQVETKESAIDTLNKHIEKLEQKVNPTNQTSQPGSASSSSSSRRSKRTKQRTASKEIEQLKPNKTGAVRSQVTHPSLDLTPQQWDFINKYPAYLGNKSEHIKTNYITEIYDRATNRFIPTTCCY